MKTTLPFTRFFDKDEFFRIFTGAFTAPTDRPLRTRDGKLRPDLLPVLAVFFLSAAFYFIMNLSFAPRFEPELFKYSVWTCVSLAGNGLLGLGLSIFPKSRPLAFIPFSFLIFPLAFLIVSLVGVVIPRLIPSTLPARGLDWKFVYDCVFFLVELVFIVIFLAVSKTGNPFSRGKQNGLPMRGFVRFWEIAFILVVAALLVFLLAERRFPMPQFVSLLKYQIPFALLLGLKEELFFRWILARKGESLLGSRILSVCFMALIWSLYHGFFGEGVGSGFWSAFWVSVVSFWWALLSYRKNSIWAVWLGHTLVELYGFYLMYIPYLD